MIVALAASHLPEGATLVNTASMTSGLHVIDYARASREATRR